MTSAARLVLADCEEALQELIDGDVDLDVSIGPMRRRRWITVVALLRAVGHVLKNVDGESSPILGKIIKAEWDAVNKTKPDPHILWGFIENERNTVVKEYRFRSHRSATGVAVTSISFPTASGVSTIKANKYGEAEFRLLTDGAFAGRNDIDVATEAIQWWKVYLDKIEAQAAGVAT
jgi:hypothetical protein